MPEPPCRYQPPRLVNRAVCEMHIFARDPICLERDPQTKRLLCEVARGMKEGNDGCVAIS